MVYKGKIQSFHLTNNEAAESIMRSHKFRKSATGMLRSLIYFAGSPKDCERKAQGVASWREGAVLQAQVDLGYSLVVRQCNMPVTANEFLGISSWSNLTEDVLKKAGCNSVYDAAPLVSRDEWAVPSNKQISNLTLMGYAKSGEELPFWCWPVWVHALAAAVQVDMAAVDSVSASTAAEAVHPSPETYGVRVNSAGRPIHDDGRFMSYSEARSRGWGGAADQNPWYQYQQSLSSQHLPRQQVSEKYRDSKSANQPDSSSTRGSNSRSDKQSVAGCGHGCTQEGMKSSRPGTSGNAWNAHQRSLGGQGYTAAQIQEAYTPHSIQPSSSVPKAPNAWNEYQHAMGGLGLSRAEMVSSYQASRSQGMGSMGLGDLGGGGGLGWNAFRSSVAGQGMSRSEISAAYRAQK